MRDAALIIALAIVGVLLAVATVAAVIHRRATAREAESEPVSPAGTTPPTRHLPLLLVRWAHRLRHRAEDRPAPTAPDQPDETDEPAREESGADEDWGAELHAMTQELALHPGFTTDELPVVEAAEFDYHGALNKLQDDFQADVEHFWNWIYDRLGVDAKTRLRLPSAVEQTGEISLDEIKALLMEGASA